MIIKTLSLKNFKQYRDVFINFPDGLTGLVGSNGAGKSTIFDAITFALFGSSADVALPLLKNDKAGDKEKVEVILEFAERGEIYKITRTLAGNKNLTASATFYKWNESLTPDHYEVISEQVVNVRKDVHKIIKVDRKSFINSFFAKQKETAGLIASGIKERELEIRKMLGFDRLDKLSKRVGEIIKAKNAVVQDLSQKLVSDEVANELDELKKIKLSQLETLESQLADKAKVVTSMLKKKENARKSLDNLRAIEQQFTAIEIIITGLKTSILNSNEMINSTNQEITELTQLQIKAQKLAPVVAQLSKLEAELLDLQSKKENKTRYDSIQAGKTKLELSLLELEKKLKDIEASITTNTGVEGLLTTNNQLKLNFEENINILNANISDLDREIAGYKSQLKEKEKRLKHINGLDESAPCPECERELGTQKPLLVTKYNSEISSLNDKISQVSVRLSELQDSLSKKQNEMKVIETEREALVSRKSKLQTDIALKNNLTAQIESTKQAIDSADHDLNAVGNRDFDQLKYNDVVEQLDATKIENNRYQKMMGKVGTLPAKQQKLVEIQAELQVLNSKLLLKQQEQSNLDFNKDLITVGESDFRLKDAEHLKAVNEHNSTNVELNSVKTEINNIDSRINDNEVRKSEYREKVNELELYRRYNGMIDLFKVKVMSTALPGISTKANELFRQITGERYDNLRIDQGSFEIFVNRDDKEVLVETLSGGEKDLVAVCLRIAISQYIIKNNGGGNLGFLALDEVFGSQDENRRGELMSSLHNISKWFNQVFIVAHNKDVEEQFPNRITISKSGDYSKIETRFAT